MLAQSAGELALWIRHQAQGAELRRTEAVNNQLEILGQGLVRRRSSTIQSCGGPHRRDSPACNEFDKGADLVAADSSSVELGNSSVVSSSQKPPGTSVPGRMVIQKPWRSPLRQTSRVQRRVI